MKSVILYFGSFNPIHYGHLAVAKAAQKHMGSTVEVWFVLSPLNPFKTHLDLLPEEVRWQQLLQALKGNTLLKACNTELLLPKPSYTVNTLHALQKQYPHHVFDILMGEDNLQAFVQWKSYQEILEKCRLLVYPRCIGKTQEEALFLAKTTEKTQATIPQELVPFSHRIILLNGSLLPISSTFLR